MKPQRLRPSTIFSWFTFPLVLLGVWHFLVVSGFWPRQIMATPLDAARALGMRLLDGSLISHGAVSLMRLVLGFAIGAALGVSIACLSSVSHRARAIFKPALTFLALVPAVAWTPVLILSFGLDGAKVALIALGAGGVVFSFASNAITATPTDYLDMARLHRKTTLQTYRHVIVPHAAYSILGGMRIAMALCWVLLISSELIASSSGLGWFIWDSRNFSRPGDMAAGMITVAILGVLADALLAGVQIHLNRWQTTSSVAIDG